MGRHSFSIVDGKGIEVYRRVQAPRDWRGRGGGLRHVDARATGVPGLDEMTNGGYFLGSTTLVVGITGSFMSARRHGIAKLRRRSQARAIGRQAVDEARRG